MDGGVSMLLNNWMSDCKQAVLEWEHDVQSTTGRLNVWSVLVCCTWYLEHLLLCWWPILHFSKAAEVSLTISFIWFKLHLVINHFHWCVAVAKKALLYSSSKGVSTTRQQSTERKYMFTAYCLGRQLGNSSRETGWAFLWDEVVDELALLTHLMFNSTRLLFSSLFLPVPSRYNSVLFFEMVLAEICTRSTASSWASHPPGDLPQVSRAGRLLWAVCPTMVQVCFVQLTCCHILPSVLPGLVWIFREGSVVYLRAGVRLQQGLFPKPGAVCWTMNAVLSSCTWCSYFIFVQFWWNADEKPMSMSDWCSKCDFS